MPAGTYNFTIEQGTTFRQDFAWKQSSTGPVIPLSGYTARMQLRTTITDPSIILELTTENGGIIIDGVNGVVTVFISATQTASLTFVAAVYDLELVSPGGAVTRWLKGKVTLDPEVTR